MSEQIMERGENDDWQRVSNKSDGKVCKINANFVNVGERRGERDNKDDGTRGEQSLQPSQWLKSILPEGSKGWWDVREKGNGMTIKFRWRDPDLQVITLLRLTSEQIETLKQSNYENAKSRIREQISLRLHTFSLDPAKRDKALTVVQKLRSDITVHSVHT